MCARAQHECDGSPFINRSNRNYLFRGSSFAIDHKSFCNWAQFQRTLFLVLRCSSGLGACRHPPGWFHFDISPLLPHVFPSILAYITSVLTSLSLDRFGFSGGLARSMCSTCSYFPSSSFLSIIRGSATDEDGLGKDISMVSPFSVCISGVESNKS